MKPLPILFSLSQSQYPPRLFIPLWFAYIILYEDVLHLSLQEPLEVGTGSGLLRYPQFLM